VIRFVPNKTPMPRSFARLPHAKGLVAERDVKPMRGGKIAAKVLVFENRGAMRAFWKRYSGYDITRNCGGVVNALCHERIRIDRNGNETSRTLHGDRRYFCMVGLALGDLCAEFITHEAVHAGFCYEKRVKRNVFGKAVGDFDEERIAYPVGRIMAGINSFLHDEKLYDRKPVRPKRRRRK
jgi:hypothetical protein